MSYFCRAKAKHTAVIAELQKITAEVLSEKFDCPTEADSVAVNYTKDDIDGDYTIVLFPYVKRLGKNPMELGKEIGEEIVGALSTAKSYNVLKGFLNINLTDAYYKDLLKKISQDPEYGREERNGKKVMVEFSSPNTNKPLHLGHIRNILLGWSVSQILDEVGYEVIKTQIVNNRGIAICKSMLAWSAYGEGATPESTGIKGDHFIGKYYVEFETRFKAEYKTWQESAEGKAVYQASKKEEQTAEAFFKAFKNNYFNTHSALGSKAKDVLLKWEAGDTAVVDQWKMMNDWVYAGFDVTYDKLGVSFDSMYYESDTYLLGKQHIEQGLEKGVFYKKDDGSVWIDLEDQKLDHKLVLRSDGTSVYMTQDIGTVEQRYAETGAEKMVYTVADEQDYHFKALFAIMKKLGASYADGLHHLSYGMVDLPTGKMKSREGTVVDADVLMEEVAVEAKNSAAEKGEIAEMSAEEQAEVIDRIAKAALKFFILRVGAKKRMVFDPKESLDMQGQTGPYIQNAYVRIASVLRKQEGDLAQHDTYTDLQEEELVLIQELAKYPEILQSSADNYDPSNLANYCYNLAKSYHRFYHEQRILTAETEAAKHFRIDLSVQVAKVLKRGMFLLGIDMPERM